MIDHNHFICHFIFGGHLLNIPKYTNKLTVEDFVSHTVSLHSEVLTASILL